VNLAKSYLTVAFPEFWLFFLGALFIAVTLVLPEGVVGLGRRLLARRAAPAPQPPHSRRAAA
jgi:urea transport system permease protein